jgi:hypothetical protein
MKILNISVALLAIIAIAGCSKKSEKMTDEEGAANIKNQMQYKIGVDKLQKAFLAGIVEIPGGDAGMRESPVVPNKYPCAQGAKKVDDGMGGWEVNASNDNRFDLSVTNSGYSTDKYGNGTWKVVHPNWEEQSMGDPENARNYTFNVYFSKPLDSLGVSCVVDYLKPEVNHNNFDEHLRDRFGSLSFSQDKLRENDKSLDPTKVWDCRLPK